MGLALLTLLVAGLLRSHADILRALHDLGAHLDPDAEGGDRPERAASRWNGGVGATGRPAADVTGFDLDGAALSVGLTGTSHDTVLVFLTSGCQSCLPFWEALRRGAELPARTRVVAVVRDPGEESASRIAELAGPDLPVIMSTGAWETYEVPGSPHLVHVDGASGRVVGEGGAATWPQVLDLLQRARADRGAARAWLPDPVPSARPADDRIGADAWTYRDNASRIDAELSAVGIGPDHPSLRPTRQAP